MCQMCRESIDQLFLHCQIIREVWTLFLSFFGVSWVFPYSIKGNPFRIKGLFCGQEEEGGVATGTVMLVLGHLEGKEYNCF